VVAVISDHGEGLGDHREDEHGMFLYDATVRIPFAMAGPGLPAGRIASAFARNVDVAPTLLVAAGLEDELDFPDGIDLTTLRPPTPGAPGAAEPPPIVSESVFPVRFYGGARVKALRWRGMKYVLAPRPELYDVDADPGETRDLLADAHGDATEIADDLRRKLVAAVGALAADPSASLARPASVDDDRRDALLALGYVGAGAPVPTAPETEARGIDPKDLIDVTRALRYVMDGRYDEARPRLARFWRTHPEIPDSSWNELFSRANLGQAFLELTDLERETGHVERAREHLRAALRLDPDYEHAKQLALRLDELERR
jgi:hypothetical protein